MRIMEFEMKCPKCRSNKWKLLYRGQSEVCDGAEYNTKTKNVSSYIGITGGVHIICKKCGWEHEIEVGSD